MTTQSQTVSSVNALMTQYKSQIAAALPKHMTPERLSRIALTELRKTPKLMECDPKSFVGAIMICAQLGLEPGGALGHIYLIPFENRKKGIVECQTMIGYRGMIDLSRRSRQVISLQAHEVYENDFFEFEYGLNEMLKHVPNMNDRGKNIKCFYAVAKLVGGGHQIEVMSKGDVDKIKAKSKGANAIPWSEYYAEMGKKTVIRKLFKYLPVSIEIQQAVKIDEEVENGHFDSSSILDDNSDSLTFDGETGEIIEPQASTSQADALANELK